MTKTLQTSSGFPVSSHPIPLNGIRPLLPLARWLLCRRKPPPGNRVRFSIVLLTLLMILIAASQPVLGQLPRARQEMELYRYAEAIPFLEQVLKKDKPSITTETLRLLATCYRKMNQWQEALTYYRKALNAGDPDPETRWYYALSLYRNGDYSAAKSAFAAIPAGDPFSQEANHYAAWCDSALLWLTRPETYATEALTTLNSPQSEFGAIQFKEGLLFTSDRLPDQGEAKRYGWTGNGYLALFLQPIDSTGNHSGFSAIPSDSSRRSEALSPESKGFSRMPSDDTRMPVPFYPGMAANAHNGPASLPSAEDKLMINRTLSSRDQEQKKEGSLHTHLLKIYTLNRTDGGWTNPEPFFLNSGDYSVGHPALSPDGHTLIFVSDMPGGFGGTDLYRCTWKEDRWSEPVNLGSRINTTGNEMFPFLSGDTLLWFASDGHPGFGGLDLYHTPLDQSVPGPLRHPGNPLNTSWDDFSLSTPDGGLTGWFSSNRSGGKGSDDIYRFRKIITEEPIPDHPTPRRGLRPYGATTSLITDHPSLITIRPETNKSYILADIYYDFDKWDIREDAKPALDSLIRIMQTWPVNIELGSHTDCRGDDGYNLLLSQKRAESAVRYITGQGIPPERITAKGYGESQLINSCDCTPDHSCTEAEHQQNRRTTFMVIEPKADEGLRPDGGLKP